MTDSLKTTEWTSEGGESLLSGKARIPFLLLSGRGGVPVDEDTAVAVLTENRKDADSLWMLGVCYEYGRGTDQSISLAEELYDKSSKNGNAIGAILSEMSNKRGCGYISINGRDDVIHRFIQCALPVIPVTVLDIKSAELCHHLVGGFGRFM